MARVVLIIVVSITRSLTHVIAPPE